jgi:phage tail protein X
VLPHSSHLLQPLNVSCFALLKRAYGFAVKQYIRVRVNHIDKVDFLKAYYTARTEAITTSTIQSGFAATGLVLYNPDRVLIELST